MTQLTHRPLRRDVGAGLVAMALMLVGGGATAGDDVPGPVELKPGDRVMTRASGTRLKVENEVTATLSAGSVFRVERVKNKWLWIDAGNVRGWIKADAVVPCDTAIRDFTAEIARRPRDPQPYIARGLVRLAARDARGAEADFTAALEHGPVAAWAAHNRAVARYALGNLDGAQADADDAVRLEPDDPSHRANRASLLFARKEYAAATRAYTEALERLKGKEAYLDDSGAEGEPDRASGRLCSAKWTCARAECWLARRRPDRALADYEAALALDPKDFATLNSLAWLLATHADSQHRNAGRALELATRACELTGYRNHLVLDTMAAACAEAGDFASAARWETRALQLAGGDRQFTDNYYARLKLYLSRMAYHDETTS